MHKNIYIYGGDILAALAAAAFFVTINYLGDRRSARWRQLRLMSPLFVAIIASALLPNIDPIPESAAFPAAVAVAFAAVFAIRSARQGQGSERGVAVLFLFLIGLFVLATAFELLHSLVEDYLASKFPTPS